MNAPFLSHREYVPGYRRRGMEVGVDEALQGRPWWTLSARIKTSSAGQPSSHGITARPAASVAE